MSIQLATDIIDGITWESILGKSYSITDFVFGTPAAPTCTLESGTITFNEHLVPEPTTICILALGGIVCRFKKAADYLTCRL